MSSEFSRSALIEGMLRFCDSAAWSRSDDNPTVRFSVARGKCRRLAQ